MTLVGYYLVFMTSPWMWGSFIVPRHDFFSSYWKDMKSIQEIVAWLQDVTATVAPSGLLALMVTILVHSFESWVGLSAVTFGFYRVCSQIMRSVCSHVSKRCIYHILVYLCMCLFVLFHFMSLIAEKVSVTCTLVGTRPFSNPSNDRLNKGCSILNNLK